MSQQTHPYSASLAAELPNPDLKQHLIITEECDAQAHYYTNKLTSNKRRRWDMTTDKRTLRERSHGIDATVRIGNPGIEDPAERMDAESIETCRNTAIYY